MTIRKPAVAGMFYPAGERPLRKAIQGYLQNVPHLIAADDLKALIVPHAGYVYSGQVAAYGFTQLEKWNASRPGDKPAKIILLGPSHSTLLREITGDENDFWETPLGLVKTFSDGFPKMALPHRDEHCLEVEVPFLQQTLDDFQILPLVTGKVDAKVVAQQLMELLDEDTILVISSDLSHYYDYPTAAGLDNATNAAIENLDVEEFEQLGVACGKYPILIVLYIARQLGWTCRLLDYRNSGDVSGQKDSVVGYAAFDFRSFFHRS